MRSTISQSDIKSSGPNGDTACNTSNSHGLQVTLNYNISSNLGALPEQVLRCCDCATPHQHTSGGTVVYLVVLNAPTLLGRS